MNFSTASRLRECETEHAIDSAGKVIDAYSRLCCMPAMAQSIYPAHCARLQGTQSAVGRAKYVKKAEKLMQSVCESKGNHSILLGRLRIVVRVCDGIFK